MFSRQGGVRTEGAVSGNGNSRCKSRERRQHRMSAGFEQRAQGRRGQECRTPEGYELRLHLHQTNPKQIFALHLDLGPGSATDQLSNFGKVASFFRFMLDN